MDRLEAMWILLRVVETGSFSAASRSVGVPLATVSRKVGELEAHLGTRLLTRTTRKVTPTDAGTVYAASARRILEQVEETERVAAGEFQAPRGDLTVTAPMLFGRLHILPIVSDFLALYPDINVRLLLLDRNLHLLDDHIDVAARIGPLPDSGLMATRTGDLRTVVCASPGLIAAHGAPSSPADLGTLPIVNFDFLFPGGSWTFRDPDGRGTVEVPLRPRLSVSSAEAAVMAAVTGVGGTRVIHYQCADAVRQGALRLLLEAYEPAPLPVHLLHAGGGALPLKTRAFLDFAVPRLREALIFG